jgi:predicted kinase
MPNPGISHKKLVVFSGFVRAGKTHAARLATLALGAVYLSTDIIREQLINDGVIPAQERYTVERMKQVYDELFAKAESNLENGKSVVLDATFTKQESRDRVIRLAEETEANLFVFLVKCDEATIEERIRTGVIHQEITGSIFPPVRYDGDFSEAGIEVHRLVKEAFSPISWEHTIIDGTKPPSKMYLQISSMFASSNPLFPLN